MTFLIWCTLAACLRGRPVVATVVEAPASVTFLQVGRPDDQGLTVEVRLVAPGRRAGSIELTWLDAAGQEVGDPVVQSIDDWTPDRFHVRLRSPELQGEHRVRISGWYSKDEDGSDPVTLAADTAEVGSDPERPDEPPPTLHAEPAPRVAQYVVVGGDPCPIKFRAVSSDLGEVPTNEAALAFARDEIRRLAACRPEVTTVGWASRDAFPGNQTLAAGRAANTAEALETEAVRVDAVAGSSVTTTQFGGVAPHNQCAQIRIRHGCGSALEAPDLASLLPGARAWWEGDDLVLEEGVVRVGSIERRRVRVPEADVAAQATTDASWAMGARDGVVAVVVHAGSVVVLARGVEEVVTGWTAYRRDEGSWVHLTEMSDEVRSLVSEMSLEEW